MRGTAAPVPWPWRSAMLGCLLMGSARGQLPILPVALVGAIVAICVWVRCGQGYVATPRPERLRNHAQTLPSPQGVAPPADPNGALHECFRRDPGELPKAWRERRDKCLKEWHRQFPAGLPDLPGPTIPLAVR